MKHITFFIGSFYLSLEFDPVGIKKAVYFHNHHSNNSTPIQKLNKYYLHTVYIYKMET